MSYPANLPTYTTPDSSKTLDQDNHTARHTQEEADIIALAGKLGVGSSVAAAGTVLRGTGTGASAWGQVDLSTDVAAFTSAVLLGLLSDETGTGSAVFGTAPTISNPTLTGGGSWAGSPALTTPTIASFANAAHNHSNAAGGGSLGTGVVQGKMIDTASIIYATATPSGNSDSGGSYADWGAGATIAVPSWASKAIVVATIQNYYNVSSTTTGTVRVVIGSDVGATSGKLGQDSSVSANAGKNIVWMDSINLTGTGNKTLKNQVVEVAGSGALRVDTGSKFDWFIIFM